MHIDGWIINFKILLNEKCLLFDWRYQFLVLARSDIEAQSSHGMPLSTVKKANSLS